MQRFNKGDVVRVAEVLATDSTAGRGAYPVIETQRRKAGKTAIVTGVSSRNGFVELDGDEGVFYHPDWLNPAASVSVASGVPARARFVWETTAQEDDPFFAPVSTPCFSSKIYNKKEKKSMDLKTIFGNIRYGKVTDGSVRMSMNGPAFRNADGVYVNYDKTTGHITNVDIASFEVDGMAYYIPTPVQSIVAGDYIEHNNKPCCVIEASDGNLTVINVYSGIAETITPTKSLFGACFVSKITSLFEAFQLAGDVQDNPMASILPFLLLGGMEKKGGASKVLPLMLMSGMMKGGNACGCGGNFLSSPFALMLLLGEDSDMEDILPFLMMGGFGAAASGETAAKAVEKAAAATESCAWAMSTTTATI